MTESKNRLYRDPNLQIVFAVTLIMIMGVSSISPAFPEIQTAFGISKPTVGLLIVVFTLPGVLFTPVLGVLADRFGRKKILVPSLLLFGVAGSACFFARDFNLLLTLRFLQGIGAASLGSLNVTIIGDLYSKRQLATVQCQRSQYRCPSLSYHWRRNGILSMVLSLCTIHNCSSCWNSRVDFP